MTVAAAAVTAPASTGPLTTTPVPEPAPVPEPVGRYVHAARAENTTRAYTTDWSRFDQWCRTLGHQSLPADPLTVADYLSSHADLRNPDTGRWAYAPATLSRWVASINAKHRATGHLPPGKHEGVILVLAGVRRERRAAPRRAKALKLGDLRTVLSHIPIVGIPAGIIGRRDAAIMLLGFALAARRATLTGIQLGHVTYVDDYGLYVTVPHSKTDQEGHGATLAVPFGTDPRTCPVCAYVRWVALLRAHHTPVDPSSPVPADDQQWVNVQAALTESYRPGQHVCAQRPLSGVKGEQDPWKKAPPAGSDWAGTPMPGEGDWPLWRPVTKAGQIGDIALSPHAVNKIVTRRLTQAGLSPAGYTSHSFRAGFVTEALENGATPHEVARQTGHRNLNTVEAYARHHTPGVGNAVGKLGL